MRVVKYQATGNDFILLDALVDNPSAFAISVCDRHFGIGADGILMALPTEDADIEMSYYNSDGSVAPMCGNGMRAFAHYVYHQHRITKQAFTVKTLAGIIPVVVNQEFVSIDLGKPILDLTYPHVSQPVSNFEPITLEVNDQKITLHVLFLGTLHAVVEVQDITSPSLLDLGNALCHHPFFPSRINVNFIEVISNHEMHVLTFERGAGLTLSCGTGVSASAVYAHRMLNLSNHVDVVVRGGRLQVDVLETVVLTGPAKKIATIEYEVEACEA